MPYLVKFGYAPGDWRIETGRVHETEADALVELKSLHARFSPDHPPDDWQVARRAAQTPHWYALRIIKIPDRAAPRRTIAPPARVAPPLLRKAVR